MCRFFILCSLRINMCRCVTVVVLILLAAILGFVSYGFIDDAINGPTEPQHCQCFDYDCGCCSHLYIAKVLHGELCTNITYLPVDYGVSTTITYNNKDLFNWTVSARNPPPLCPPVTYIVEELEMELCLYLHDLDVKNKTFSGCAEIELTFDYLPVTRVDLGCFDNRTSLSLGAQIQRVYDQWTSTKHLPENRLNKVVLQ